MKNGNDTNGKDRRAAILSAAEMVFGDHGYAATTMESVADKAGISKGSIYNYFQNKEDLFKSVFLQYHETAGRQSRQILDSSASATEKVQQLVEMWFNRLSYHKHIGQLVLEFWATAARQDASGELAKLFKQLFAQWRDQISVVLTEGVQAGEFGAIRPGVASSLIIAILNGIEVQLMLDIGLTVDSEYIESLKSAIVSALRSGEATPASPQTA